MVLQILKGMLFAFSCIYKWRVISTTPATPKFEPLDETEALSNAHYQQHFTTTVRPFYIRDRYDKTVRLKSAKMRKNA